MKKLAIFFVVFTILTILAGCSSDDTSDSTSNYHFMSEPEGNSYQNTANNSGYSSAETAAVNFLKSVLTNDGKTFSKCVHPNMLEDWADSFHIDPNSSSTQTANAATLTQRTLSGDEFNAYASELKSEYGIMADSAVEYYISAVIEGSYKQYRHLVTVFSCNDRWYACGWS